MARLSTALSTSFSGLALASRMTQTIANNVANATTTGYAAREVNPLARTVDGVGLGVTTGSITRNVDPALLAERRVAEGQYALFSTQAEFYADVERLIGLPDDASALSNQVADLQSSLVEAATRPESDARLTAVLNIASGIAAKLGSVSDGVQQARMRADQEIARSVDFINETLQQIADLNVPQSSRAMSSDVSLNKMDQRQALIDQLSELVPVRELSREDGTVVLFTPGGSILLDGRPAEFDFTPVGVIVPGMAIGGALSGLTINGQPVDTAAEGSKIAGGKLAALFDLRDVQAPDVQARLDAAARDLVDRFADPAVDPTLGAGDAGLFTDAGSAFDPLNEIGLATRIAVNPLVDPAQGGALWRLRDGLGAGAPGSVGDATLLNSLASALQTARVPASGGFFAAASAAGIASEVTIGFATTQSNFARQQAFMSASLDTLITAELANGVDTDQEMQRLLLVEQAYAANAQVIQTIDELLDTLLRI